MANDGSYRPDDGRLRRGVAWLQRPAPRSWTFAMFVVIGALVILGSYEFAGGANRQAKDEHNMCLIQARGLPASHELASIIKLFYKAESLPPTAAERRAQLHEDPRLVAINHKIKYHLARYLYYENGQPAHRSCAKSG